MRDLTDGKVPSALDADRPPHLPQQQHLPELLALYLPVLLAQYLPWQQRLPELLAPRLSQRQRLPVLLLLVPLGKFGKQIYLRRTQYP